MPKNRRDRPQPDAEETNLLAIKKRLDAIVLLFLKSKFSDENGKINLTQVVPMLHSAGYTPTEIALMLGKKKATDVSSYIYSK